MSVEEATSRKAKLYTRLAIAMAFLLALFWSLGSFLIWTFLGAIAFFTAMALIHRQPISGHGNPFQRRPRPRFERRERAGPRPPARSLKLVIFFAALSMIFLAVIVAIFSSINQPDAQVESGEFSNTSGYRDQLAANPNDLDALTNLGNSFYSLGQYDSALKYYNRVLTVDPHNSSGLFNKGLVYFQQKKYPQSIEVLRQCAQLYPDYAEALMLMGDNYYDQGKYTEAMQWYVQAYDKGARTAELLNIMGFICEQQNRKSDAVRYYKEALKQDSSQVSVYERLIELDPGKAGWYRQKASSLR
jgi:tetratricopeptide (TPR) repeat protein